MNQPPERRVILDITTKTQPDGWVLIIRHCATDQNKVCRPETIRTTPISYPMKAAWAYYVGALRYREEFGEDTREMLSVLHSRIQSDIAIRMKPLWDQLGPFSRHEFNKVIQEEIFPSLRNMGAQI